MGYLYGENFDGIVYTQLVRYRSVTGKKKDGHINRRNYDSVYVLNPMRRALKIVC